jgi:DNA-directed RNA polymerase subunit RPC12/RpoP
MSARSAKCPACGAEIEFANVATRIVVCSHCRYASIRKGQELEKIGLVAEVAPIESPIALRARGKIDGKRFSVVGQVQLDHGAGPWNEWNIVFESGESGWLAEAQGQYLVTFEAPAPDVPGYSHLRAGMELDLGAQGR